jgi:hypothetical protein
MEPKPAQKRPKKYDRANEQRTMEKAFEIEFRKKSGEAMSTPKKRRRQEGAADYDREKVCEQFGGIFQGR